eukprot:CAMPEP_0182444374 /NCGR_PEP_ID=MMETSP1172-20130603/2842_1 /TAXON_ID=708627 /ORGANISM="Timspurckia oligopyrenoides, Strain CCMP3278" /LENGTH=338 /DNA_ID=CAMNT_0024639913 /DNA_START=74 /DNA_END=1090 /DNA_ORIENTATION=+
MKSSMIPLQSAFIPVFSPLQSLTSAVKTSSPSTHSSFLSNTSRKSTLFCKSTLSNKHSITCAVLLDDEDEYQTRNRVVNVLGNDIIYDHFPARPDIPAVVYLPGFFYARSKTAKINALQMQCRRKNQTFLVADYSGTGRSKGDFAEGTVSRWLSEIEAVLDEVLDRSRNKVVLVGSGIGGWIMVHLAMRRPDQVVGLVGLSADPDFTEELLLPALTDEQRQTLEKDGMIDLTWGYRNYPIHKALIEDGKKMVVLNGGSNSIAVKCPVRLIQGMADEEIPTRFAFDLVDKLQSKDVNVTFVKNGDHALELDDDFARMWYAVCDVSDRYFEFDLGSPASG